MFTPAENGLIFKGTLNIPLNVMATELFGRRRECRFYTAGCGNKMAVRVTGPTAIAIGPNIERGKHDITLKSLHQAGFEPHGRQRHWQSSTL